MFGVVAAESSVSFFMRPCSFGAADVCAMPSGPDVESSQRLHVRFIGPLATLLPRVKFVFPLLSRQKEATHPFCTHTVYSSFLSLFVCPFPLPRKTSSDMLVSDFSECFKGKQGTKFVFESQENLLSPELRINNLNSFFHFISNNLV